MFSEVPALIAEISANHLGSFNRAEQLVRAAHKSGATHVKFQHLRPDTISVRGEHPDLTISGKSAWTGRHLWDLYEEAMMPWEWTHDLVSLCEELGIGWLSTPFDESAVDFLENFSPGVYKIASFEIVDLPLIRYAAHTGRPLIISTGMATELEIDRAVAVAKESGASEVLLMRTNSSYPAPINQMDLAAIPYMSKRWGVAIGLSDHTLGDIAGIVAIALGATVVEKHLTLSRSDGGPDAAFSSEPREMENFMNSLRAAYSSLGERRFGPSNDELGSLRFRPSLRAVTKISEGETITNNNVQSVRPAGGLAPESIDVVIGKRAIRNISVGDPITEQDYE